MNSIQTIIANYLEDKIKLAVTKVVLLNGAKEFNRPTTYVLQRAGSNARGVLISSSGKSQSTYQFNAINSFQRWTSRVTNDPSLLNGLASLEQRRDF